ncbi:MAG: lyase family protein, partial [Thermoanaerobaculia bacterium]
DSQVLQTLAGLAETCHKFGTDLRLLQGVGELSEPFDAEQVGSSAMAYKRNPVRAERMCGLSRRLITDSLNGPLNAATQWLERSLDDSANRRLVIPDSFLDADAVLGLAAHISAGLVVREGTIASRVARELPFMATETLLMEAALRGGDRQLLQTLAGIAESCHKFGTDLRLLQGVGELSEPFDAEQVGSSAMAYKRNPVRAERMCGLARRLITDSLNGPLNASVQWLERSLDDSANRRLVLPDAFLCADAILGLAAHIAAGLSVREEMVAARVARELPFMATETLLMEASLRGGDRQELHETIRRYSLEAQESLARGGGNLLIERIVADPGFRLTREEVEPWLDPVGFTGRSAAQVDEFLEEVAEPALAGAEAVEAAAPRI